MNISFLKRIIFIVFLLSASILALSIRGNWGNPTEITVQSKSWKEDGPFELSPERGRFALAYSIIENNSVFFSIPLARFVTPDLGYANGKYVSLFAPALSYIIVPGYLIGKVFGASQVGSFATISLFALGNLFLIYTIAKKLTRCRLPSILAGIIFLFATPAYAYGVNLYQHHVSTFIILAACYLVINYRSFISLALVWFLTATSLPLDYPNLILMIPIALFAGLKIIEVTVQDSVKIKIHLIKILSVAAAAVPLAFLVWFNTISYSNPTQFAGTIENVSRVDENGKPSVNILINAKSVEDVINSEKQDKSATGFFRTRDLVNGLYILVFSPDRGILGFTPVILLSIIGMISLFKKYRTETVMFLSIVVTNILLYAMWGDPWGGWAFGSRYLIPSYAILAIFLASAISTWRKNILFVSLLLVLGTFSIFVNTAGALSTNANPPQVQVLELERVSNKEEKYTYERNLDYLKIKTSKSFFYRTWARNYISSWQYYQLVANTLALVFSIGVISVYLTRPQRST